MLKKRVGVDGARAIHNLGYYSSGGIHGLPQDRDRALELYHRE